MHYFEERTSSQVLRSAVAEADLALRFSAILADEVLVPAAAYYENSTTSKLLAPFEGVDYRDIFFLVGGGASAEQFAEEKLEQYAAATAIGERYRKKIRQPFPWRTRRRSSTADIRSDWLDAPKTSDVLKEIQGGIAASGSGAELDWLSVPERLGKAAFVPGSAWKLMPSLHDNFLARRRVSAFVNQAYFSSYLKDVAAGVIQRMPWLSGGQLIPSMHPELDLDFKSLEDQLRDEGILQEIRSCSLGSLRAWIKDERFVRAFSASQGYVEKSDSKPAAADPLAGAGRVSASEGGSKLMDFIVVAATQELGAIRELLDELKLQRTSGKSLGNRHLETFSLESSSRGVREVGLMLALGKGKSHMKDLLEAISQHSNAEHVIMVGMMAGIHGKCRLLDVVAPKTIYDGTAIGTKDGRHIGEPEAGTIDARLHHWTASLDAPSLKRDSIRTISHKKTVTVAAKIDDITHDLARSALAADPENVIGLEMEGSALVEQQGAHSLNRKLTGYLMIKGVADYAGALPDQTEIEMLKQVNGISVNLSNADPTNDPIFKATLQREATRRALFVALEVLKSVPEAS